MLSKISDQVLSYNKSNDKELYSTIISYLFSNFYKIPLDYNLILPDSIGKFIEISYTRFDSIINSYKKPLVPFEAYLKNIIFQEAKFYNIKSHRDSSLKKLDNEICVENDTLDFFFAKEDQDEFNYEYSEPVKQFRACDILCIAIACEPQLSSYQIDKLNSYFKAHGIYNYLELCKKAHQKFLERDSNIQKIKHDQVYLYHKILKLEQAINEKNICGLSCDIEKEKLDKSKKRLKLKSDKLNKSRNRITYREIAEILDTNSNTVAAEIRKVKKNLEFDCYKSIE